MQKLALQSIINEIRTATATMTSVPKPLKFLSPHVDALKARCEALPAGSEPRALLADVVSVLCTTVGAKEGVRDALKFRLQVGSGKHWATAMPDQSDTSIWGSKVCLIAKCWGLWAESMNVVLRWQARQQCSALSPSLQQGLLAGLARASGPSHVWHPPLS